MSGYSGDGVHDHLVVRPVESLTMAPLETAPVARPTVPPLPDTIEQDEHFPTGGLRERFVRPERVPVSERWWPRFRSLRTGCYLLRYEPGRPEVFPLVHYDGTLRVERDGTNTTASGDLYLHRPLLSRAGAIGLGFGAAREPDPSAGIPIFARSAYRYYVRVTQILETFTLENSFTLGFELYRFDHTNRSWTNDGAFAAEMMWLPAPPGYPSTSQYLRGQVRNSAGRITGTLTMGWVSAHLRRATIEIDRVAASETPLENGAGIGWQQVFEDVGWEVTIDESDSSLGEPSGESWSDAEMHAEMLARRDAANLDAEWRYHLICVRRIDSTERGIMYDNGGTDSNKIPREGAGIASHWRIPDQAQWGLVRGMRFGEATAPYYRTAVHELGHAFGLYHNTADLGFMNTTDVIAASATPPQQFPQNIRWAWAADDAKRLRHMPDMWVRPGGIAFGASFSSAPISPDDLIVEAEELELRVSPLMEAVPFGAPVRVNFTLTNAGETPMPVPASLSLKSGFVKGKVVGPSGVARSYWPLVRCIEQHELRELAPGESTSYSMTLLRGAEGALFPSSGPHTVVVEIEWDVGGISLATRGQTAVVVTPPVDDAHAEAALRVLSTPDAHLTLALGGDHLDQGIEAIQVALDNPVLRPHYAVVEAKRLGKRFRDRKADVKAAAALIDDASVMSPTEIKHAAELVQNGDADSRPAKNLAKTLQDKLRSVAVDSETEDLVRAL